MMIETAIINVLIEYTSDVVLETRVSVRDSSRHIFQKARFGLEISKSRFGSPLGGKSRDLTTKFELRV
jgi:hypothetical protein